MGQDPAGAPAAIGINNHPVEALCEHQASPLLPLSISLHSWELGPCAVWLLWTLPCPVSRLCAQAVAVLWLGGRVSTKQLVIIKHLLCVL